jgi:hypothetical protein
VSGRVRRALAELGRRLRDVVGELGTSLGSRDAAMVLDLADHDEFGVAFEALRDVLIENGTPLANTTVDALVELAELMQPDAFEDALRGRSAEPS